jgi:hypothetical protein
MEAHPAMRRIVILAKIEVMKLVFMDLRFFDWFYRIGFSQLSYVFWQAGSKLPIGL